MLKKVMESYEEFCLKSMVRMRGNSGSSARHGHTEARSAFRFQGRHVLLPRLSEQQHAEMAEQRQRAVQIECERHAQRLGSLIDRVQDVITHVQLQKVQDEDVHQVLEISCSKRAQSGEQPHSRLFLNSTAQRKETLRILNSQMKRVRKRGEEEKEDEIQPDSTSIVEIQAGGQGLRCADMQSEQEKEMEEPAFDRENESCRTLKNFPVMECSNCVDCSFDTDQMFPDSSTICASIMDSYARLPSPPNLHPCKPINFVSFTKSDVHPHYFTETVHNTNKAESSGVDWNCSCSDLTKTSCNLFTSSTLNSLRNLRPISVLNKTQPEIIKQEKSQFTTQQRSPPALLNQSYDVENPSLTLLRPQISSGSDASETFFKCRLELINQEHFAVADILQDETVDDVQILQTACEHSNEHHTLQVSDIPKEQEEETQRYQQDKAKFDRNGPCQSTVRHNSLGHMRQR